MPGNGADMKPRKMGDGAGRGKSKSEAYLHPLPHLECTCLQLILICKPRCFKLIPALECSIHTRRLMTWTFLCRTQQYRGLRGNMKC